MMKIYNVYKCKRCGDIVSAGLAEQDHFDFHICSDDPNGDIKIGLLEKVGMDYCAGFEEKD